MLSGDQLGMWLCCHGGCVEAAPRVIMSYGRICGMWCYNVTVHGRLA